MIRLAIQSAAQSEEGSRELSAEFERRIELGRAKAPAEPSGIPESETARTTRALWPDRAP
jgi:hypothetical protein